MYLFGKSMVVFGGGVWCGESGVVFGLFIVFDNGNWVLKGFVSSILCGDFGVLVGVGY